MSDSESDDDYYGPALPPGFQQKDSEGPAGSVGEGGRAPDTQIGPILPPELREKLEANAGDTDPTDALESEDPNKVEADQKSDSDSDSDIVGPLPPDHPKAQQRGPASSFSSSSVDTKPKREEWMLVPPKNRIIPGLGLGPRKFLTRTPMDSKKSDDDEEEEEAFAREAEAVIERKLIDDYDKKMDEMKSEFETKKRRGESLLEMHQKDMKKKKSEESSSAKPERKAFDRDTDLKISGLSHESKQKYIEKSKELNTKFSRGSRKYL